jgi:hypothetical protein
MAILRHEKRVLRHEKRGSRASFVSLILSNNEEQVARIIGVEDSSTRAAFVADLDQLVVQVSATSP